MLSGQNDFSFRILYYNILFRIQFFQILGSVAQQRGCCDLGEGKYEITQKGIEAGSLTEDSIVFTVKQSAEHAVERFNRKVRRSSFIKTQTAPRAGGDYSVVVTLDDDKGNLMTLELMAPDQPQAIRLSRLMEEKAENVYNLVMMELLDDSFTED